ncbi:TRAP transporter small permease [Clostridium sp. AM58-1XD]|uniref:TRAP transporter small permease n=1 Tax=Clostridium sp. AM58-1XD TaxID=2292307 RepID=UPI000E49E57F|nr:TRAP transporter small permease [Clostridium sp. AM58-1XD]RGY97145.1 TRAP transporter small permease [Clostridium sp. AM58-1XD]
MAVFMKYVVKAEKILLGFFILLATAIIAYNVIARRLGVAPQWGEEGVRYSMIWITFIGSAVCFRRSAHFGIDVIRRVKSDAFQKFVTVFVLASCALFVGLLCYYGWKYTAFAFASQQKTPALGWPIYLIYMSVPIGGILTEIHLLEVLLDNVLGVYKIQE